jgi:hypothetical protein
MSRAHDAEVATVEGRHFGGVKPLRCRDHRGVDSAERQVAVLRDELCDADGVAGMERLDCKVASGEVAEEANLGLPAQPGCDQVGDLGDDERGDDEGARMGLEQLQAGGVVGVVGVDVGVEGPGVKDQRDGAISAARISSIRSETSLWPLRPLAAAPRRRRSPAPRCCSNAVRVTSAIVTPRRSASWRSRASRSSGSFTVVRRMGCQHTSRLGPGHHNYTAPDCPRICFRRRSCGWRVALARPASRSACRDRRCPNERELRVGPRPAPQPECPRRAERPEPW